MAGSRNVTHIFHLYRKDGTAVFLHPFRAPERLRSLLDKGDIRGHYGEEPRVESITLFRNELYRLIEQEVKGWISDARFIPRFVISAAIFLVAYLFLSFVIRDPIPVLDELAISAGLSIAAYLLLGRRDLKSDAALKRRIAERSAVDRIEFTESEFLKRVESALISKENEKPEALLEQITRPDNEIVVEGHEEEAEQFVGYLGKLFDSTNFRRAEKRLVSDASPEDRASAWKWAEARKMDMPLLAVYCQVRRKVKSATQ
jgi:hypothetical protein